MRMFAQDAAFHAPARVDATAGPEARRRLRELETVDRLREPMRPLERMAPAEVRGCAPSRVVSSQREAVGGG